VRSRSVASQAHSSQRTHVTQTGDHQKLLPSVWLLALVSYRGVSNTHLPMFDERSLSGNFTLQNFLEDAELMYDFIVSVPRFISEQFNKLRSANP
jgi:hypothetical protein